MAAERGLKAQLHLWLDLLAPAMDMGYPWGGNRGLIIYVNKEEIVEFFAQHPQFRPRAATLRSRDSNI